MPLPLRSAKRPPCRGHWRAARLSRSPLSAWPLGPAIDYPDNSPTPWATFGRRHRDRCSAPARQMELIGAHLSTQPLQNLQRGLERLARRHAQPDEADPENIVTLDHGEAQRPDRREQRIAGASTTTSPARAGKPIGSSAIASGWSRTSCVKVARRTCSSCRTVAREAASTRSITGSANDEIPDLSRAIDREATALLATTAPAAPAPPSRPAQAPPPPSISPDSGSSASSPFTHCQIHADMD